MDITHPTNDPALVSYHRPELMSLLSGLELALDCWSLLSTASRGSEKGKYLPKEPGEPTSAYKSRLHRSTYTPIFRDSVRAYAGLLSRFQLIDPPPSLLQSQHDVDLRGSSIHGFSSRCDELAIRDAGVYVVVDMPPASGTNNFVDELAEGRRPYCMIVERKDVINWSLRYVNGREVVERVTVRQLRATSNSDGYGSTLEPVYLVMRPGSVEVFRVEKSQSGWRNEPLGPPIQTSLDYIPIRWYGLSTSSFAQGELAMNGLAEMSIQHFQMRSDLQELLHKCAMPVPVRKGAPVGSDGRSAPMIIGSNSGMDLPENGEFLFAEPTGRSIERHQAEIAHLEALMDRSGLNFLYGANVKTATEASLRASQISSQVNSLIRNKVATMAWLFRVWAEYAGETDKLTSESGIQVNDSLINRPIDPSGIAQMINLHKAKLSSRRVVLEELQRGGVLDPDMNIDDELRRIAEEGREEPPPPGVAPQLQDPSTVRPQ